MRRTTHTWRTRLRIGTVVLALIMLSACTDRSGATNAATEPPSSDEAEASSDEPPPAEQSRPGITTRSEPASTTTTTAPPPPDVSLEGAATTGVCSDLRCHEGYSVALNLSVAITGAQSSIEQSPPGRAAVSITAEGALMVTNATPGRALPYTTYNSTAMFGLMLVTWYEESRFAEQANVNCASDDWITARIQLDGDVYCAAALIHLTKDNPQRVPAELELKPRWLRHLLG